MTTSSNFSTIRTTESGDRNVALTESRGSGIANPKPVAVRVGGTVRRLLNALMRSLAAPHI